MLGVFLLVATHLQSTPGLPPPALELRVVPDCRFCTVGEEVDFHTFYRLDGAAIVVQRSTLDVEDAHGTIVFAFENPFCWQPGERMLAGSGTSNCAAPGLLKRLAALPAGDYAATWRLNDVTASSFRPMGSAPTRMPSSTTWARALTTRSCRSGKRRRQ
jgi:hypothetical protein